MLKQTPSSLFTVATLRPKGLRRVSGWKDMPQLVAALPARDAQIRLGESQGMVA